MANNPKGCCDLKSLTNQQFRKSLVGSLFGVADCVRQVATDLGARPYTVHMIKTRWSEGERGYGVEEVIDDTEILPVPKVDSLNAVSLQLQSIGLDEIGDLRITEISPRYTEFQLLGKTPEGNPLDRNESFFYEVTFYGADGNPPIRRRFQPRNVPSFEPTRLQWTISLVRATGDRDFAGTP